MSNRYSTAESPLPGHFYGLRVTETNAVFLLDCSSSMRGSRIERLRKELEAALSTMDESMHFAVIPFGGIDMPMFPRSGMTPATEKERNAAIRFIKKRRAGGQTPMLQAIRSVFTRLINRTATTGVPVDAIYLLSDGQATDAMPDRLLDNVDRINSRALIRIHTVSIGADSELLYKLAQRNHGRYSVMTEDAEE